MMNFGRNQRFRPKFFVIILFTEKYFILLSLIFVNYLEAYRHILIKKLPMLSFSMFFKTFKRSYKKIFNNIFYIRIPISVNQVHKLHMMGNDIYFCLQKKAFQIINSGLNNPCEVILYGKLRDFFAQRRIKKL